MKVNIPRDGCTNWNYDMALVYNTCALRKKVQVLKQVRGLLVSLHSLFHVRSNPPEHLHNASEMALYWSCLPTNSIRTRNLSTYFKDTATVLDCSNGTSTCKTKPTVIDKDLIQGTLNRWKYSQWYNLATKSDWLWLSYFLNGLRIILLLKLEFTVYWLVLILSVKSFGCLPWYTRSNIPQPAKNIKTKAVKLNSKRFVIITLFEGKLRYFKM